MAAKLSFWQKVKKAVTSPFGMGIGMGIGLGVVLAVTSVVAFGVPAIVGGLFFLTGAFAGVLGGGWAQLRANLGVSSKSVGYQVPGGTNDAHLPKYTPSQTFGHTPESKQSHLDSSVSKQGHEVTPPSSDGENNEGKIQEGRFRKLFHALRNK